MMPYADRLDASPFEADLYLQTFGGREPNSNRGKIDYRKLDDKREWESFLELDLLPAIQRVCARYGLEVSIREGAPAAQPASPASPARSGPTSTPSTPAAPPAPPPAPDDPEARLRSEMEDRLAQLSELLDEDKKAASIKRLEKAIAGLDEDMIEGLDFVQESLEEYKGIERAGMTPEEYNDAKAAAFDALKDAVEGLQVIDEDEDAA